MVLIVEGGNELLHLQPPNELLLLLLLLLLVLVLNVRKYFGLCPTSDILVSDPVGSPGLGVLRHRGGGTFHVFQCGCQAKRLSRPPEHPHPCLSHSSPLQSVLMKLAAQPGLF